MSATAPTFDIIPIPTRIAMLHEVRIASDLARGMLDLPLALLAPRGASEPVLLLPGYSAGDRSLWPLRNFLRHLRWRASGWGLGVNRGDLPTLLPRVTEIVDRTAQRAGHAVRLVGWSMGGFLAREVARDHGDLVAQIVTLGTPVVGGPKYTAVAALFRRRGYDIDALAAHCDARSSRRIDVPITAIYSRRDGVVAWQACIDRCNPDVEHVEVASTHTGLGFDVRVWRIVADRLARKRRTAR
jgi:esterase/lipase